MQYDLTFCPKLTLSFSSSLVLFHFRVSLTTVTTTSRLWSAWEGRTSWRLGWPTSNTRPLSSRPSVSSGRRGLSGFTCWTLACRPRCQTAYMQNTTTVNSQRARIWRVQPGKSKQQKDCVATFLAMLSLSNPEYGSCFRISFSIFLFLRSTYINY